MLNYEYKVLYGNPRGTTLMPWASQKMRDEIGPGSFERKLNRLADEGWEVISCSTAATGAGIFPAVFLGVVATVLLRREKHEHIEQS